MRYGLDNTGFATRTLIYGTLRVTVSLFRKGVYPQNLCITMWKGVF